MTGFNKCLIRFRFVSETNVLVGFILFTLYYYIKFFLMLFFPPDSIVNFSSVMDEFTFVFVFLIAVTPVFSIC